MAIEGKKAYKVYLTEENVELVRNFFFATTTDETVGGGFSGLLDSYVASLANTIRKAGIKPGRKLTLAKILRMAISGIKEEP